MPKLCVAIPCFNNASTISETLESLLKSNYDDWVAVVTDNGSKDDSQEVVSRYQGTKILLNGHAETIDKTANWNRAYRDLPDCDYLVTLHADDLIEPGALAKIADLSCHRPALIHGRHAAIDEAGNPSAHCGYPFDYSARGVEFRRILLLGNIVAVPAASIRRDLFEAVGGWSEQWFMQDLEMWWQLSFHGTVIYSGQQLGTYRLLDDRKYASYVREYARWSLQRLEDSKGEPTLEAAVLAKLAALRAEATASGDAGAQAAVADMGIDNMVLSRTDRLLGPLTRQRLLRLKLAMRTRLTGMRDLT